MSIVDFVKVAYRRCRYLKINIIKTLAFNFIFFPFKQAIHLPVLVWGPLKIASSKGKIELLNSVAKFGMINLGISDPVRSYDCKSYFRLEGLLIIGDQVTIRRGMRIHIESSATVCLEDNIYIGDNNTLISKNRIIIGKATRIGNNTTFMDTDFHSIININTREVKLNYAPILIGENNWIGGWCTIKKGTQTPKGTIVAGPYSMVSKNYIGKIPEFSIIAGSPAKLLVDGMRRVNNIVSDKLIENHYKNNNENFKLSEDIDIDKFCMPQ